MSLRECAAMIDRKMGDYAREAAREARVAATALSYMRAWLNNGYRFRVALPGPVSMSHREDVACVTIIDVETGTHRRTSAKHAERAG